MMRFNSKKIICQLCPMWEKSLFSDLSRRDLEFLNSCKTSNFYLRKQIIFHEDNSISGMYFIRSGKIKLYKTADSGKQQILKIARAGDLVGLPPLFLNQPHRVTAEVIEDSEICFLPKAEFLQILKTNPSVAFKLLGKLSNDLIHSEERALDLAYKSVRVRFAEFLFTLSERFSSSNGRGFQLNISLSREELAQAVGTSVETVVRLLSEFRERGLIKVVKRNISILDSERFLAFCHADTDAFRGSFVRASLRKVSLKS